MPLLQDPQIVKVFYQRYATAWFKTHGRREETLQLAVARYFREQGESVVAGVRAAGASLDPVKLPKKLIGKSATARLIQYVERPLFIAMANGAQLELTAFASAMKSSRLLENQKKRQEKSALSNYLLRAETKDIDADEELIYDLELEMPPEMVEEIRESLDAILERDYWDEISGVTRELLADQLNEGINEGEGIRELTKRIANLFDGMEGWRAQGIARTETTMALNAGQHATREYLIDEGIIEGKTWFATADMRTRDAHFDADGQERGNDEMFEVGGELCMYPGDPTLSAENRCNCRCVATSRTAFSDKAAMAAGFKASGFFCGVHRPPPYVGLTDSVAQLALAKAFCPTGQGGGVDNSCGYGEGEGGGTATLDEDRLEDRLDESGVTPLQIRDELVREIFNDKITPSLDKVENVVLASKYASAMKRVLKQMPEGALRMVYDETKEFEFKPNLTELRDRYYGVTGRHSDTVSAFYVRSVDGDHKVVIDGDRVGDPGSADGIYAHELTHALDYGAGTIIESPWYAGVSRASDSDGWRDCWEEIRGNNAKGEELSRYATSSPTEGFAEFGRMVYSVSRERAEAEFPKSYAFFKDNGLL